jgi:hypothetical protein
MTLSIATFSIKTPAVKGLFEILRHTTLSITTLCHRGECLYAERQELLIVVLNVIMMDIVMLSAMGSFQPGLIFLAVVRSLSYGCQPFPYFLSKSFYRQKMLIS